MSTARATTRSASLAGITVRSPRLLMTEQWHAGSPVEPDDVHRLLREGALRRTAPPSVVVYQVLSGEHRQTGVVAEVAVDDYRTGRVRRHEATDPEREQKLVEYTETVHLEQTPVMLAHAPRPGLRDMLATVTATAPDVDLVPDDGHTHRVWVVQNIELLRAVQGELGSLGTLYIADGHHRMATAGRYAAGRPGLDAHHPAWFTLGALFPSDEMWIFGYPRGVPRPAVWSTDDVVAALATAPGAARVEECASSDAPRPVPGTAVVFVDGRWYRVWLRGTGDALPASLDSVRLDEGVIRPVFGGTGKAAAPGTAGSEALAEWCVENEAIGFLPYPPSVPEVMAVSDAGELMPAKSTWFDPKAPRGLFLRELT